MKTKIENTSSVPVAVRCFPASDNKPQNKSYKKQKPSKRPAIMMVIDTETATENTKSMKGFDSSAWNPYAQSLLFGSARIYVNILGVWTPATEFTFYPSYLPDEGIDRLKEIISQQTYIEGGITRLIDEPEVEHRLIALDEFIERFYETAYDTQGLVVGFNLPFDLSRIACGWSKAKSKRYKGGFVLKLTD